jgi:hypothetical protein
MHAELKPVGYYTFTVDIFSQNGKSGIASASFSILIFIILHNFQVLN